MLLILPVVPDIVSDTKPFEKLWSAPGDNLYEVLSSFVPFLIKIKVNYKRVHLWISIYRSFGMHEVNSIAERRYFSLKKQIIFSRSIYGIIRIYLDKLLKITNLERKQTWDGIICWRYGSVTTKFEGTFTGIATVSFRLHPREL